MRKNIIFVALVLAPVVSFLGWNVAAAESVSNTVSMTGHANWESLAYTISDQIKEADVVVRARALKAHPVRELRIEAPAIANGRVVGKGFDVLPFTDTEMLVLDVYKGSPVQRITVMQTGGTLPEKGGNPAVNVATEDDPLFVEGEEYVLFLKDISGDAVHAPNRRLYRVVNPAGRYHVEGTAVSSPYGFPKSFTPPQTLTDLVERIGKVLPGGPRAPLEN